jgi:hypothetical protein
MQKISKLGEQNAVRAAQAQKALIKQSLAEIMILVVRTSYDVRVEEVAVAVLDSDQES